MRKPAADLVLVQAVIAGALSFAHLHDLASAAGQHGWKGWAYPVSVDLLLVAAWHRIRQLRSAGSPAGAAWCWFATALAASLGANVATAGLLDLGRVPALLRIVVAGWPALAFFGGTLLAHSSTEQRHQVAADSAPAPAPAAQEAETSVYLDRPAPAPAPAVAPAAEPEPVPVPELPAPTPEPAPAPPAPRVAVPPALLAHARKLADAHHARTGTPMPAEALRAALGVPPVLADAITAQLA